MQKSWLEPFKVFHRFQQSVDLTNFFLRVRIAEFINRNVSLAAINSAVKLSAAPDNNFA